MDYGRIGNLLIWTAPEHPKPIRINDSLLTIGEAKELIKLLELTVKSN